MKFASQFIQKLEPEQDRQTHEYSQKRDRKYYHVAFVAGNNKFVQRNLGRGPRPWRCRTHTP